MIFLSNFGPNRTGIVVFNKLVINEVDNTLLTIETSGFDLFLAIIKIVKSRVNHGTCYITITDNNIGFLKDFVLLTLTRLLRYKIVAHSHSGQISEYLNSKLKIIFYEWALDRLIILSTKFRINEPLSRKILVIPNVADNIFYKKLNFETREYITFVGSFFESKGVISVVKAFIMLKDSGSNLRLKLIGKFYDTETRLIVTDIIKRSGYSGSISLEYILSRSYLKEILYRSKFFIFPSVYKTEAYPLALVEALLCGCYAITTDWAAMSEILFGIPSSIIAPKKEINIDLYNELKKIENSSVDHAQIREMAINKFSKEKFITRMKFALSI